MAQPSQTLNTVRFGPFELSLETQELRKHGVPLKLSGQAIQVLAMLTTTPGKLVTREELQKKLWPADTFGDFEHGLNAAVNKLREKLGDSATTPTYIETLQGRGYRFVAKVQPPFGVEPPSLEPSPIGPEPTRHRWKAKAVLAILVLALLVVAVLYPRIKIYLDRQIRIAQLQRLTLVPLTSLPGRVATPTFSPDGTQVAFGWDGENNGAGYDLYVKVIGTEIPLRLTHHPAGMLSAAWSPDGRGIAVSRLETGDDSGIYLVPRLGGPERKLTFRSNVGSYGPEISWSPDGKYLAFIDHPANSQSQASLLLFMLNLETLERIPVNTGCNSAGTPSFSPRGDFLAWVCTDALYISSLHVQRRSDGSTTQLLQRPGGIRGIAWSRDGQHIVFSSPFYLGDLWEVSVDHPDHPEKLPVAHDASAPAVSPMGNRLAFRQHRLNVNIWRLDLTEPQPHAQKAVASSREQYSPDLSPDGRQIAFQSNRSGTSEIWVSDIDGSNALQLTSFGGDTTGTPRWSPDGKLIAFGSRADGEANIYLIDPHGGVPRKLNIDIRGNLLPSWSHDGNWIYFVNGNDAYHATGWKVPSTGGHAVPITQGEVWLPVESPDGQLVYFIRQWRLWSVRSDGTDERQVEGMPDLRGWTPFKSGIYFIAGGTGGRWEIKFFDLETKKVQLVYVMEKPPALNWVGGMPVSRDGKWLFFPQVDEQSSDLMMIENWN